MAIDLIKLIIADTTKIAISGDTIRIIEKDNTGKPDTLKKLIIKKVNSSNTLAFKFDFYNKPSNYFSEKNKIYVNKGCDCILFTQHKSVNYILFLEMKSFDFKEKDVANKMWCSLGFIKYLNFKIKKLHNYSLNDFRYCFFSVCLKKPARFDKFVMRTPPKIQFVSTRYNNGVTDCSITEISQETSHDFSIDIDTIITQGRFNALN